MLVALYLAALFFFYSVPDTKSPTNVSPQVF